MRQRRASGEGHVRLRADGRWEASVAHDGRRVSAYGKTRQEAVTKMRDRLAGLRRGLRTGQERLTVGAYIESWLATIKPSPDGKGQVRPSTWRGYDGVVRVHLLPRIGRLRLRDLTVDDVDRLLAVVGKGHSSQTVNHVRAILRAVLNRAMREQIIPVNVAKLAQAPQVNREEAKVMDPAQVAVLLAAMEGHPLQPLVTVAVGTGLRQGELLGLRWRHVDTEERTLRVPHALQRVDGKPILVTTKTHRSKRTLKMAPMVAAALKRQEVLQRAQREWAGSRWQRGTVTEAGPKGKLLPVDDLVFTNSVGGPLDPSRVTKTYQAALKRAGLPRYRFYDLRHTAASLWLLHGVPARVVMEMMGHSTIRLTMDTYTHVMPVLQDEAAEAMEQALGGGTG